MHDIIFLDHNNPEAEVQFEKLRERFPYIKRIRFVNDYLHTLVRVVYHVQTEHCWVVSSICDYEDFDFRWEPPKWEDYQLHAFPSGKQKFGDTFFFNAKIFSERVHQLHKDKSWTVVLDIPVAIDLATIHPQSIKKLEYYEDVNWRTEQIVRRLEYPVVTYDCQSPLDIVKQYNTKGCGYFWCINEQSRLVGNLDYNPSLWENPHIHVFEQGGDVMLLPRAAKTEVSQQLSDYPYIMYHDTVYSTPKPQDIVFISNGEKNADKHYDKLCEHVGYSVKHVSNINDRTAAYKKAAELADTPWFFAVFAKCDVDENFDFSFHPDILREECHYIFYAKNPINDLEYGHQGIILYNTQIVLNIEEKDIGLDFTLSSPHTTVSELSCVAAYDTGEFIVWKTAFREVLKLLETNTIEAQSRLTSWLTIGNGVFGKWSIIGANDAKEYHKTVKGDSDLLKCSYEWQWLENYFNKNHSTDLSGQ